MRTICVCGFQLDTDGEPNIVYVGGPYLGRYVHEKCVDEYELMENLKKSLALPDRKGLWVIRGRRV